MPRFSRANAMLIGLAVLGCIVISATEVATGMKVQAGPLLMIIVGFAIATIGVLWHLHLVGTEKPLPIEMTPSNVFPSTDSPRKEEAFSEKMAGGDIANKPPAGDPPVDPNSDKSTTRDRDHNVNRGFDPVSKTTTAQVELSDPEIKSAALLFAKKMRAFEQPYDSKRDQIVAKPMGNQAERDAQIQELRTLEAEKAAEFIQAFLPQAQLMQAELLRRLQRRGIEVIVPPPPRGISIALGRSLLQLDISGGGLPGHRPIHGLASYLEMLASNLPD
jgi:hypothetical protein